MTHGTAYIIHGWDNTPNDAWFPWLKQELEQRGFTVVAPQLPQTEEPRIANWVPKLKEIVTTVNERTFFVGHSMGCQTIARFLESLPEGVVAGGAVFVAGFFKELSNLEDDETVRDVAREWLTTPVDLLKVKQHLKASVAIFSDNDQYVPASNQEAFKNILGATIIEQHHQDHFSAGTTTLPAALEAVLDLAAAA